MMQETVRVVVTAALAILVLFGTAALLTGCESAKYYECIARDRTANPCN